MKEIKKAALLFAVLTLLTGVVYPAAVTAIAQFMFPEQAAGSLILREDGTAAGSTLIGQVFSDPKYFWSRPSATADYPYNAMASGGSNLGPTNKDLIGQIGERIKSLRETGIQGTLPPDLVMASGSGLDPHISIEGALLQVPRVARERHMPEETVKTVVLSHLEDRQFGFLGAQRINVLKLNLAMDRL